MIFFLYRVGLRRGTDQDAKMMNVESKELLNLDHFNGVHKFKSILQLKIEGSL